LWAFPARLPLGAGFGGRCMAAGHHGEAPAEDELKQFCNLGYSSGCARLPEQRTADANRFFVRQQGAMLLVDFCSERQHLPVEHASLRFDSGLQAWIEGHGDACVQRQAECAVESFVRRREAVAREHDVARAAERNDDPPASAAAEPATHLLIADEQAATLKLSQPAATARGAGQ